MSLGLGTLSTSALGRTQLVHAVLNPANDPRREDAQALAARLILRGS
jgi:hypothetical protein